MNFHVKCNDCAADLVLSKAERDSWLDRHLRRCPDHLVYVTAVTESVAGARLGVIEGRLDNHKEAIEDIEKRLASIEQDYRDSVVVVRPRT